MIKHHLPLHSRHRLRQSRPPWDDMVIVQRQMPFRQLQAPAPAVPFPPICHWPRKHHGRWLNRRIRNQNIPHPVADPRQGHAQFAELAPIIVRVVNALLVTAYFHTCSKEHVFRGRDDSSRMLLFSTSSEVAKRNMPEPLRIAKKALHLLGITTRTFLAIDYIGATLTHDLRPHFKMSHCCSS